MGANPIESILFKGIKIMDYFSSYRTMAVPRSDTAVNVVRFHIRIFIIRWLIIIILYKNMIHDVKQ